MPKLRSGIDYGILETSDDALQSLQIEHRLGRSLNDFFNSRIGPVGEPPQKVDVDSYWTADGLAVPSGYQNLSVYSRAVFSYPQLAAYTKLPTLATGLSYWVGVEAGMAAPLPIAALHGASDGNAYVLASSIATPASVKCNSLLPSDYDTAEHLYTIKVNKASMEMWIDDVLKAVFLYGVTEAIPEWQDTDPYVLGSTGAPLATTLSTLIEISKGGDPATFPLDITGNNFVATNGDPLPPRQFAVYTENTSTKWSGSTLSGTGNTSHPVPVLGYPNKTLLFQSDSAGTLKIEVYAGGGWRQRYTKSLTANELFVYTLAEEYPIARCVYDATNSDSIAVAEWLLS